MPANTLEILHSMSNTNYLICNHVFQDDVAGCFEYYADLAEGLDAKQKAPVSLPMDTFKSYTLKEPIGFVAVL